MNTPDQPNAQPNQDSGSHNTQPPAYGGQPQYPVAPPPTQGQYSPQYQQPPQGQYQPGQYPSQQQGGQYQPYQVNQQPQPPVVRARSGVADGVKMGFGMFFVLPFLFIVGCIVLIMIVSAFN